MMNASLQGATQNRAYASRNFYSQWERVSTATPGNTTLTCSSRSPTTITVSPAPKTRSRCKTAPRKRVVANLDDKDEVGQQQRFLEVKIKACRSAIETQTAREVQLLSENIKLKSAIQSSEKPSHEAVKLLLRKYEKFRGGMTLLSENFARTLQEENASLQELELTLQKELDEVQREVDDLDERLKGKLSEIHVLVHYKDKEYPVKAIRIAELTKEVDNVEMSNRDEFDELQNIVEYELEKLHIADENTQYDIKSNAMEAVLTQMHPSLKEMAKQNQVMQSEITYHTKMCAKLQDDIECLQDEVKKLLRHPKTNLRKQVFPELFKPESKCSPDDDIVLDIPTIESIPI